MVIQCKIETNIINNNFNPSNNNQHHSKKQYEINALCCLIPFAFNNNILDIVWIIILKLVKDDFY